jgi:hypothetical protein
VWAQSGHEVVFASKDLKSVWKMRGDEELLGGRVCSVWSGDVGRADTDHDDSPPCLLLIMIVGGRIVVLATSTLGFCHELLQYALARVN